MPKKCLVLIFLTYLINLGIIEESNACLAASDSDQQSIDNDGNHQHYIARPRFETPHLKLESISSAEQDIACYRAIYSDCGWQNSWFSGCSVHAYSDERNTAEGVRCIREELCDDDPIFESQHERIQAKAIEKFRAREQEGFYTLPSSFPDYVIWDKETGEIVGKFISCHAVQNGRTENGIYVLSKFRKKGYASEALAGVVTHVIKPGLGKAFVVLATPYPEFKGMCAKIAPWYNYPSLKLYSKVGCVTRWDKGAPITFYPPGDEQSLDQSNGELQFLNIIMASYMVSERLSKALEEMEGSQKRVFPVHLRLEQVFYWVKKLFPHKFIELVGDTLDKLCTVSDEPTASFAQKALDVLDEESSEAEEDEEIMEDERESGRRRQRGE